MIHVLLKKTERLMMQPLREGTQVSDTVAAHGDPAGRWESQSAAAVSCHSVLLPERFGGPQPPFTFGTRVYRASPVPHPPIVLPGRRAPESFTPSADESRFPMGFHCRYSVCIHATIAHPP